MEAIKQVKNEIEKRIEEKEKHIKSFTKCNMFACALHEQTMIMAYYEILNIIAELTDMKPLKIYICDNTPTDEEIASAIETAKHTDCFIKLEWFINYNGWHSIMIDNYSNIDDIKSKLPKCYGI